MKRKTLRYGPTIDERSDLTPDQRASLARLAERGLIERTSTRVTVTTDARFNLEPQLGHSEREEREDAS